MTLLSQIIQWTYYQLWYLMIDTFNQSIIFFLFWISFQKPWTKKNIREISGTKKSTINFLDLYFCFSFMIVDLQSSNDLGNTQFSGAVSMPWRSWHRNKKGESIPPYGTPLLIRNPRDRMGTFALWNRRNRRSR